MNVIITGATRGLGLALATRYAKRAGTRLFATARTLEKNSDLQTLASETGAVTIVRADMSDPDVGETIAAALGTATIDLLINNAGVTGPEFGAVTQDALVELFKTNTFAPILIAQALRAKFNARAKIVNITSVLGSIELAGSAYFTYGMSKAALNMLSKKLAVELDRVAVLALHPGWVQTRLGGPAAPLSTDTSADGMVKVIDAFDLSKSGTYLAYDGSTIPW
jgi:NAD(P)-dependent dehydrogenase (short-subunit alcohol dehydrogenase family)